MTTRALVVDDDRDHGELVARQLRTLGYDVDVCDEPTDGMTLAEKQPYAIVFLDLAMDSMSGLEFCENLRAQGNEVPIVIATGYSSIDMVRAAMAAGAN